tara:strand:- start:278 stop:544 length:267 start_codon:yes stop_codon:yes gene_type:complete
MSRNTGLRIDIQGIYFQRETDGRGFQGTIRSEKQDQGQEAGAALAKNPIGKKNPDEPSSRFSLEVVGGGSTPIPVPEEDFNSGAGDQK